MRHLCTLLYKHRKKVIINWFGRDAAEHKYIEESGTMNIVFQIGDKLITPDENHDTILRGITKRSVLSSS